MTMACSRRRFLNALGSTAGAVVAAPWLDGPFWPVQPVEAASLSLGDLKALVDVALDRARAFGSSFAGILIERRHVATVSLRANPAGSNSASSSRSTQLPDVLEIEGLRVGVRVVRAGVSGYAESSSVDEGEIALLTERAVATARAFPALAPSTIRYHWVTPRLSDPSEMARKHRRAFRHAVTQAVREWTDSKVAGHSVTIRGEHTCYVSTRGNCTHLSRVWEV
jgi:predicted Zn-dependent protease